MTDPAHHGKAAIRPLLAVLLVLCAWAGVVAARLVAPSDLATRDQERVAAYVFDITENGHWLAQDDTEGNFASKPPLFNWLAAVAVLALDSTERLALSFPSWIATALTALLVLAFGARHFGRRAGLWAALLYFCSQLGLRQVLLLRTDALFQHLIFVGLLCGFEAVERRRTWVPFWLAGLGSTMTKGPLGLLLAAPLFRVFDRAPRASHRSRAREHAIGIAIFLALGLAWMLAANAASHGRAFHKLVADELVGHAIGTKDDFGLPFQRWNRPFAWFLTRLAPMSLFAIVGIWRGFRRPATDIGVRRFESLLRWQVLVGLIVFAAASENRFEHLMSIIPASALLAGRECARVLPHLRIGAASAATLVLILGSNVYLSWFDAKTTDVAYGENLRAFAAELAPHFHGSERLNRFDAPRALFVDLGRFEVALDAKAIAERIAQDRPTWIAVSDDAAFRAALATRDVTALHPLVAREPGRGETITVWSNRPTLPAATDSPPTAWLRILLFGSIVAGVLAIAARTASRTIAAAAD